MRDCDRSIQDKTVRHLCVDRGSMHAVQHHVVYSPERKKHIITQGFTISAYYLDGNTGV